MPVKKTAVGIVDKAILEKLYNNFDTRKILDAVDDLDEVRGELEEPGGPRNDLFRLHQMAMYLINDDAPPGDDDTIWELAEELSSRILDCQEKLEHVYEMLEELSALAPDPDEADDLEDGDEDEEDDKDEEVD